MLSHQNATVDTDADITEGTATSSLTPDSMDVEKSSSIMMDCMVRISHLMETEITQWIVNNRDAQSADSDEGYNLCRHNQSARPCRLPRKAKTGVVYDRQGYSSSDDNKTSSRYHKARTLNKFSPHSGPSSARLVAHHMMQSNKECVVAEGLLNLQYGSTQPVPTSATATL